MKRTLGWISFFMVGLMGSLLAQTPSTDTTKKVIKVPNKTTLINEFSYSYGYVVATYVKEQTLLEENELRAEEVLKGLKEGLNMDSIKVVDCNHYLDRRESSGVSSKSIEEAKKVAYSLGCSFISNICSTYSLDKSDFNYGFIKKGYMVVENDKKPKFTEEEAYTNMLTFYQKKQIVLHEKILTAKKVEAAKNLALGQKFLEKNAKKEGIKTTASGLQYQVIKEGEGALLTLDYKVVVHYTGTLINGKVFDCSADKRERTTRSLSSVILGWEEGLQLMKKGSHYRLFIPESLGYEEDNRLAVPPSSALIYDIEVIDAIEEEASIVEARKQMSYSYGYLSGQQFDVRGGFNIHEKDRSQFLQGFNAGFEAKAQEVFEMRHLLESRKYGSGSIMNIKSAKKIAFSFGVCAASDLMESAGASVADFDFKILSQAYSDAIEGKDAPFSEEEMGNFIYAYFLPREQAKKEAEEAKKEAEEAEEAIAAAGNIAIGAKFMEENQKKEGVVTMANGLQYLILEEGTKDTIRAGEKDNVMVHIHGTLIDGTVIYSTREDNKPMAMNLGTIIEGLATGIPLMPIGGKYRFFIPPNLVLGNEGSIFMPEGATLILEVELMEIN